MIKSTYLLGFFAVMMLNVPASVYGMAQSETVEKRNGVVRIESPDKIGYHSGHMAVYYDKNTGKYDGKLTLLDRDDHQYKKGIDAEGAERLYEYFSEEFDRSPYS